MRGGRRRGDTSARELKRLTAAVRGDGHRRQSAYPGQDTERAPECAPHVADTRRQVIDFLTKRGDPALFLLLILVRLHRSTGIFSPCAPKPFCRTAKAMGTESVG